MVLLLCSRATGATFAPSVTIGPRRSLVLDLPGRSRSRRQELGFAVLTVYSMLSRAGQHGMATYRFGAHSLVHRRRALDVRVTADQVFFEDNQALRRSDVLAPEGSGTGRPEPAFRAHCVAVSQPSLVVHS